MPTISTADLIKASTGGGSVPQTKTAAQLAEEERARQLAIKNAAAANTPTTGGAPKIPGVTPPVYQAPSTTTTNTTLPAGSTATGTITPSGNVSTADLLRASTATPTTPAPAPATPASNLTMGNKTPEQQAAMEAAAAKDPKLAAIIAAAGTTTPVTPTMTTEQLKAKALNDAANAANTAKIAASNAAAKPQADKELARQRALLEAYQTGNTELAHQIEAQAPKSGSNPYSERSKEGDAFSAELIPLLQQIDKARKTVISNLPATASTEQLVGLTNQRQAEVTSRDQVNAQQAATDEANKSELRRQQAIKDALAAGNNNLAKDIIATDRVAGSTVPIEDFGTILTGLPKTASTDELIRLTVQRQAEDIAQQTGTPVDQAAVDKQVLDINKAKLEGVNTSGAYASKTATTPEYQARAATSGLAGRVPTGTAQLSPETQAMLDAIKSGQQDVGALYKQEPGASAYDLQRQNVQAQSSQQKESMLKAMKERLSAQGLGTGSGISDKQQRLLDVESARTEAAGLGQVNIAEATAKEQERLDMINKQYAQGERLGTQQFNLGITSMQNDFTSNRMALADQIDDANKVEQSQMDAAYKQGLAGVEASPESLAAMSDLQFSAYQQGKSGRSYEDYTADRDAQIQYKNALITKLDPDSPTFQDDLSGIYQDLGLKTGTVTQPTVVYSKLQGKTKDSTEFKTALTNTQDWTMQQHIDDRGMFTPDIGVIDNPPAIGTHFKQGGEIYEVTSGVQEETNGENYQWFNVKNVRTGEIKKIQAGND